MGFGGFSPAFNYFFFAAFILAPLFPPFSFTSGGI
jgi:hypothetical protein